MTIFNKKYNFKWFSIVILAFPLCKLLVGREQAGAGGFEEGRQQHPTKHSSRKDKVTYNIERGAHQIVLAKVCCQYDKK